MEAKQKIIVVTVVLAACVIVVVASAWRHRSDTLFQPLPISAEAMEKLREKERIRQDEWRTGEIARLQRTHKDKLRDLVHAAQISTAAVCDKDRRRSLRSAIEAYASARLGAFRTARGADVATETIDVWETPADRAAIKSALDLIALGVVVASDFKRWNVEYDLTFPISEDITPMCYGPLD